MIFAGVPGQESGNAIADVLYGDVNPSGRLPFTIARKEEDYGTLLNSTVDNDNRAFPQSDFTEGLYVDYRAFDAHNITPRYEFGYGLSYTSFSYTDLTISPASDTDLSPFPSASIPILQGGHPQLWEAAYIARINITNTGDVPGREVPQLYVGIPNAPKKQLRGFERTGLLQPGESTEVEFSLKRRDLSIWNVVEQSWELQQGKYKVSVGASSRDVRLTDTVVM